MKKQRISISTTHIILLSFLIAILIGALLLMLPISSADNKSTSFLDALFTATTSTCVTGLVVTPTVSSWSVFGQVVILSLIQIGGLGVITIMSGLMILLHRKIGIGDRMLLQDAFNLNSLSGIVEFVKKVVAVRHDGKISTTVDPALPLKKGMQLIVIAETSKLKKIK